MGMLKSLFRGGEGADVSPGRVATMAPSTPSPTSPAWPPAPEGNCDVCNTPITQVASARVPNREFKELVVRGYNPFESGRVSDAARALYSATVEDAYESWKAMALMDTTDWGLCAECAADLRTFMGGSGEPSSPGEEPALGESEEPMSSAVIDPSSIKLIAAFWVGMSLDEQDPLQGIFPAWGALNKELAAHLLERRDLLTQISFLGGPLSDPSEAESIPAALHRQATRPVDVYDQRGAGTLMGQSGTLCAFTCVPGTGSTHVVQGPLLPTPS